MNARDTIPTAVAWRNVEVDSCVGCPFLHEGGGTEYCTHPVSEGHDLVDLRSVLDDEGPPPPWCPLRTLSTLVQLKRGPGDGSS